MYKKLKISIKIIAAILFCIIIFLPGIQDMLLIFPKQEFKTWENRYPAEEPEFDITKLDPYPPLYDEFYNDNFAFRNTFLEAYVNLCYFLFNTSPFTEKVIIGDKGQMFEGDKERKIYDGTHNFSNDTINLIIEELRMRTKEYRKNGIRFYFTISPMNHSIHPERLPIYFKKADSTFTERLIARLEKDTIIPFINQHKHLYSKREESEQFCIIDNHWNTNGAFNAYQVIMDRISIDFPEIKTLQHEDFLVETKRVKRGNLAQMIGLEKSCYETDYIYSPYFTPCGFQTERTGYIPINNFPAETYEETYKCSDQSLPIAVLIRDSYMDRQEEFFKEHFRKTTFIFDEWKYRYNEEVIYSENADIVLLQIFEPHVVNLLIMPKFVNPAI